MRSIVLNALLATTLLAAAGTAAATPPREWSEVEPLVRRSLAAELSRREIDRLLKRRDVRRHLQRAFSEYDGPLDSIEVRREGRTLHVQVITRQRRRTCLDLGSTPETSDQPACEERVRVISDRTVEIPDRLWKPRKRPKRPRPEPESPPEDGPPPPSVLRERRPDPLEQALGGMSRQLVSLLSDYAVFREELPGLARFKDPLEPEFRIGDPVPDVKLANQPPPKPLGSLEGNAMENLRYQFDESRMGAKLDMPVPDFFGDSARPTHLAKPPQKVGIAEPSRACLKAWGELGAAASPPKLACFRNALRKRRLDKDDFYTFVSVLATVLKLPLLEDLMAMQVRKAEFETVSSTAWVLAWLEWVKRNRKRMEQAVGQLASAERVQLRRRLWRWWSKRQYARWERVVTDLYEHHFAGLYPTVRGRDGLPERRRFRNDYLWATNWLTATDKLPEGKTRQAFGRLAGGDRAIIGAMVTERRMARRFPRAVRALAERAKVAN